MTRKGKQYPAEVLTTGELDRLLTAPSLRAPTGVRNRALMTFIAKSGLRISEALALRVSDINMKDHSIRVLDTKSGQPQTRGFHPTADDILIRWADLRKQLGFNGGPLFCTLDGTAMSEEYVRQMIARMCQRAGIDKRITPHSLRHQFAVQCEAAGMPVTVISKLLGHSSVGVTSRYLSHLTNHEAVAALTAIQMD